MTASVQNPYSAVPTGACLICGEAISYQVRGRPRLYCERVRCRRRGARRRALAVAWEEGRAAAEGGIRADLVRPTGPTYDDGVQVGQELGRADVTVLVRLLWEKGDAFIQRREGSDFEALDRALIVARRWLDNRPQNTNPKPAVSRSERGRRI